MAYRRRYRKRNYRRRRRPRYRRKAPAKPKRYVVADMAYKGFKLASHLAGLVNIEMKHQDISNNVTPSRTGTIQILNAIPQGDTDVSRDGDSLKMQHYSLHGRITHNSSSVQAGQQVRVMIIFDDQVKVGTAADVLNQTTTQYAVLSHKDYDKRFQTKVLYDRTFLVNPQRPDMIFNINLNINKHTQYEAGTTTVNTGSLKMLYISDEGSANLPGFEYTSRLTFTDN